MSRLKIAVSLFPLFAWAGCFLDRDPAEIAAYNARIDAQGGRPKHAILLQDAAKARDAYADAVYKAVEKYSKAAATPDDVASASITSAVQELEAYRQSIFAYIEEKDGRRVAELATGKIVSDLQQAAYRHAIKWTLDVRKIGRAHV